MIYTHRLQKNSYKIRLFSDKKTNSNFKNRNKNEKVGLQKLEIEVSFLLKPSCLYFTMGSNSFQSSVHIFFQSTPSLQVNLCQKLSFLNQLNHNKSRDCLLNSPKNTSSQHVVHKYCFECQNKNSKQFLYTTRCELVLLSYCGLTDARMRASEKDLPLQDISQNRSFSIRHREIQKNIFRKRTVGTINNVTKISLHSPQGLLWDSSEKQPGLLA